MTQEKQLLLADICSRLSYKVLVLADIDKTFDGGIISRLCSIDIRNDIITIDNVLTPFYIEEIRPYLRPMSNMTEEEKKEISILLNYEFYIDDDYALTAEDDRHRITLDLMQVYIDWLNKHHFDYHNLIERGLAIEVTEENNPYKE